MGSRHHRKIKFEWFNDSDNPENWFDPAITIFGYLDLKDHLRDPDEIVIKEQLIFMEFLYPLKKSVVFEFPVFEGFSRLFLAQCIYEGYFRICSEEERTIEDLKFNENPYNRENFDGTCGFRKHEIDNLRLDFVEYDPAERYCLVQIES